MDRLSGDFNRGYTRAIQDIAEILDYISNDLKHHKKQYNAKTIHRLMDVCLLNREHLREKHDGLIRWNSVINDFEWFKKEG